MKYSVAELKRSVQQWPKGFAEAVLAHGKVAGDTVMLDAAAQEKIKRALLPPARTPPARFNIVQLQASAARRPDGFVDYVLAQGKAEGEFVTFAGEAETELRKRFPSFLRPVPPEPSWAEMAANFTGAMAGWAKAGFKVVEREVFEQRHATCLSCEYWDAKARAGLGKCRKCGCSRSKLWLATAHCPLKPPKW